MELDSDAEVLRYIVGRARSAEEAQARWAPICADRDADAVGLGCWVGWSVADDVSLGLVGPFPHEARGGGADPC